MTRRAPTYLRQPGDGEGWVFPVPEVSLDMGWVYRPVFEQIIRFEQSVAKYPNIKTREEFKGYSSQ